MIDRKSVRIKTTFPVAILQEDTETETTFILYKESDIRALSEEGHRPILLADTGNIEVILKSQPNVDAINEAIKLLESLKQRVMEREDI